MTGIAVVWCLAAVVVVVFSFRTRRLFLKMISTVRKKTYLSSRRRRMRLEPFFLSLVIEPVVVVVMTLLLLSLSLSSGVAVLVTGKVEER